MEDPGGPYRIALAVILLCCSAAFSASETALFSVRTSPKKQGPLSKLITELRNKPEETLSTILLGNTMVNVVFTSALTAFVLSLPSLTRERAEGIAALASFLLLLTFGEVGPKTVASLKPLAVLALTARPLSHLRRLFLPLTFSLTSLNEGLAGLWPAEHDSLVTQQQLVETAVIVGEQSGAVKATTGKAIRNVIATNYTPIRNAMTPRAQVQAVEVNHSLRDAATLMAETGLSRLPVYRGGLDTVIGLVHVKDIMSTLMSNDDDIDLECLLRPIYRSAAADSVTEMLRALRNSGTHMSAVYNSQNRLIGIATVEDLVEEIVGEIADEHELFSVAGGR